MTLGKKHTDAYKVITKSATRGTLTFWDIIKAQYKINIPTTTLRMLSNYYFCIGKTSDYFIVPNLPEVVTCFQIITFA